MLVRYVLAPPRHVMTKGEAALYTVIRTLGSESEKQKGKVSWTGKNSFLAEETLRHFISGYLYKQDNRDWLLIPDQILLALIPGRSADSLDKDYTAIICNKFIFISTINKSYKS